MENLKNRMGTEVCEKQTELESLLATLRVENSETEHYLTKLWSCLEKLQSINETGPSIEDGKMMKAGRSGLLTELQYEITTTARNREILASAVAYLNNLV